MIYCIKYSLRLVFDSRTVFLCFRTICLYGIQYRIGLDKDYSDAGYIYGLYFKNTRSGIRCMVYIVYKVIKDTKTLIVVYLSLFFVLIIMEKKPLLIHRGCGGGRGALNSLPLLPLKLCRGHDAILRFLRLLFGSYAAL